ncbi:MAG: GPW/gp25 family protein [Betaproteobacteria bacterium]|jgi:phage baseplate assembly protein W
MKPVLDYPFHPDARGRSAITQGDEHVRDMIEQLLFTNPGERVMRPDFGCGLMQLLFAPNDDLQATTVRFLVLGSLQRWLGDLIAVDEVSIHNDDARLEVVVAYTLRLDGRSSVARFRAPAP